MNEDLRRVARRFVDFVHTATRLPMMVCDETGTIVESVDRRRIGTSHAFAKRILAGEADELFVTAEDVAQDPRMKEGCNCVIVLDGQRVGTFGLAGSLEIARPLARIAAAVVVSWAQEERQRSALKGAAAEVFTGVAAVSGKAAEASAESEQVVGVMVAASKDAAAQVERTDLVVRTVQEIAQKSRILSINGSVEAARAGEQGRGFAVVAREMLALAEGARTAANEIQVTLSDAHQSMGRLGGAIDRSAALARGQTAALAEVRQVVEGLQRAVAELAKE
ncbi:sugar diacid recognition domain-containing protein [Anaeromyxobacter diazotrophicus]|uniref:Chemotaxis protein n=1 Tax=Anaeromyxobacter diazotrophicus TaxID=2590199 RepID=A0A7I9VQK4_9BACT|nr:sugar diacid recognition domain-containing protein [Anaeromyxobacter diazotrophicus]GEJ58369.1 chemotaxis protein [Anaeromyxobacter diazotrophicus]